MARCIVITPSPDDLGYHHQVARDAWSGRCVTVRCLGARCWRLVYVDSRNRLADHDRSHRPYGLCELSGMRVIDRARPDSRSLVRSRRMGA
ncbi:hypothetical protein [Streptomyces sp. NPDC059994]|uniref:hypothetical protein n=1 Tax=Streptomyces sp. NPDC059994 TaxID=3347029 RepID=UPI00368204FC